MSKISKTNNRQKTGILARKRRGGQPGNRNAAKPVPALSTRIRDLQRRARAVIGAVDSRRATPHSGASPHGDTP